MRLSVLSFSFLNHILAAVITNQITLYGSIALFIYLSFSYKSPFWEKQDRDIKEWALNIDRSFIKDHAEDFAIFGNAIFHISYSIIIAILVFLLKKNLSIAISFLFTLIFSWGLNRLLKLIFRRQRPSQLDDNIRKRLSYCYPSGHVMASLGIYFFSSVVFQTLFPILPWYLISLFVCYAVIMTRIFLNHHYFTDILGGILMGIVCLNVSVWFYFLISLIM